MPAFRRALLTTDLTGDILFTGVDAAEELEMPSGREIALLHVRWSQAGDGPALASLRPLLSEKETQRADRFRVEPPRASYILSQGYLRILLGELIGKPPADIEFTFGPHGKPYLSDSMNPDRLMFNLSHSGEDILFAVTRRSEIGVDIETARERSLMNRIAERHYHPNEVSDLEGLEGQSFIERFYGYWTLKEAWIKALGHGLRYPIATLDFSQYLPVGSGICPIENADWWCRTLELRPGIPCALARRVQGT